LQADRQSLSQNAVKGEKMARLLSGFVVMIAIIGMVIAAVYIGSTVTGMIFDLASMAGDQVLAPMAAWLSEYRYGRLLVSWIAGITVSEEIKLISTILAILAVITAVSTVVLMVLMSVIERMFEWISN
jgi:hypothetical protein